MTDIMIDIETLDTQDSSAILNIAAIKFDPFDDYSDKKIQEGQNIDFLISIEPQLDRTINDDTIQWWGNQPVEIQEIVFREENRIDLHSALVELTKFCWQRAKRIWAQGPQFDINILNHAYKSLSITPPWEYHSIRDSRTLLDLADPMISYEANHVALSDCWGQILKVQSVLRTLKVTNFQR